MFAYFSTVRFALRAFTAALWLVCAQLVSAQITPAGGAVSSGTNYTLALKADGTVWAWGLNSSGQLGLGNTTATPSAPVLIPGLNSVAAIATGDAHSIALRTDGTVRTWGKNTNSQLGNGLTANLSTPYQPTSLTGIIAVAAGDNHSLFLKSDGTVWACGLNTGGQLGQGNTTATSAIVQVKGPGGNGTLTGISAIAAGAGHSLALKSSDGTVYIWGINSNGQIGDGTTTSPRTSPYQIPLATLSGVTAIAAGDAFSIALKADNTVRAWGLNSSGQLGDGTTTQRTLPVTVTSLAGATAIAAGDTHAIALKANGTAFAWGLNSSAQLGIGNTTNSTTPVQIPGVTTATSIAGGTNHTHLILSDGRLLSFGDNSNGQLGDGLTTPRRLTLVQPTAWTDVSALATGASHTLAVRGSGSNSTVWSWGLNTNGQLGDNSTTIRRLPVQVPGLAAIAKVAAGASHSLALTNNGTLRTWGLNTSGQLGNGNTTQSLLPLSLASPTGITAIAAGDNHSLALKSDGTIWVWGLNANGQLGDGLTANRTSAFQLTSLSNATAVAAGNSHSLALKSDGTVWAWGLNTNGRLGDNSTTQRLAPVQVKGVGGTGNLTGITAIAAAGGHSLALKTDGTLYAWGLNANGQLGDNSTTQRLTPVQVKGPGGVGNLTGVTAIGAGEAYSLAILSDGTARAWGLNTDAQLGNGNLTQSTTPLTITGLTSASRVAAGDTHALALRLDQTLRAWGNNTNGALGSPDLPASAAAISLKTTGGDTDADGLPDAWETSNWGNLAQAGSSDPDADGLTNVQEYLRGTNPTQPDADLDLLTDPVDAYPSDYYNALVPTLTILGGNNQTTPAGQFNPLVFDVAVWNSAATAPLVNAPVTFTVLSGGGQLAVTAAPPLSTTLNRNTDIDGTTDAFYQQPATAGASQIRVTAGTAQVIFNTTAGAADTTAPSVPTGLSSSAVTGTSFSLSWSASTDNVSAQSALVYDVYRGGTLLGTTAAGVTTFPVSGLTSGTTYAMTVRARDAGGNNSAQSTALNVTTADTIAPSVPAGLSSSSITATTFTLSWTASTDNVSAQSTLVYEVYRGGTSLGTTAAGVTSFPVSGLTSGTTYAMTVRARDVAGNFSAQSSALNVTTSDTTAPSVPTGLTSSAITGTSFTLSWAASTDNLSAQSALVYDVYRGGTLLGTTAAGVTTYPVSGLTSSTTYAMTVRARDAAGNNSAQSTALNVTTADTTAPTVPAGLSATAITGTSFTLNWTASTDNVSAQSALVYQVYRGGTSLGTTAAGVTSFPVSGLTSGTTYTMTVRARDVATNFSAQSTALNVTTLDTTPPTVPGSLTRTARTSTSISLSWTASTDNVAVTAYELYNDATLLATITAPATGYTATGLTPSTAYSLKLRAKDAAGNTSAYTSVLTTTTLGAGAPATVPGLVAWYQAGTHTTGNLATWLDVSGNDNHATQVDTTYQPQVFTNAINGQSVVRFDGNDDVLNPPNILSGASEGEIYIVNRLENFYNQYNGLCQFGVANGVCYSQDAGDLIWEDFGIDDFGPFPGPGSAILTQPHIYNSSITPAGVSTVRFDGRIFKVRNTGSVVFTSTPLLGNDVYNERYRGDIAEVIVFNRSLTSTERDAIHAYLATKYAPPGIVVPATPSLNAHAVSGTKADLTWSTSTGTDQHLTATLERKVGTGSYALLSTLADTFSYTDTGLTPGETYTYRVKLTSYAGESAYSTPATVTTPLNSPDVPTAGLRLWLRASAGTQGPGPVSAWFDQSGQANDANQLNDTNRRPVLVENAINGQPAVRFDGMDDVLNLPDCMNGATGGEVFMVMRLQDFSRQTYNNFLDLSATGAASKYTADLIINAFGAQEEVLINKPDNASTVTQVHLFNSSISNDGTQITSINDVAQATVVNRTVGFTTNPMIGNDVNGAGFYGDIAEVIVFDRVLSQVERTAVEQYLNLKYRIGGPNLPDPSPPSVPQPLTATRINSTRIDLAWPASTDDIGVSAYDIYCNGLLLGSVPANSYSVTGLSSATTYQFAVRARDAFGNASSFSPILSVATLPPASPRFVDSDEDGLSDTWEIAHGLNPNSAGDALLDVDGDGLTNLAEYLVGSDPHLSTIPDSSNQHVLRVIWP